MLKYPMPFGRLDRPLFHIVLIASLGVIAYSNTFDVPFQWDGVNSYIVRNPVIKDLGYFLHPDKAKDLPHFDALTRRYIGYLTFALNYKFNGLDVRGYHLFNTAVHVFNAILVYYFAILVLKTPFMLNSAFAKRSGHIALLAGLLFVSHPVQTEAVTYIFQRLASLAAFFYLSSMVLYTKWRLCSATERVNDGNSPSSPPLKLRGGRGVLYFASLLSAVLAMKTKENAFTLPIMVCMSEFLFFNGQGDEFLKRALYLVPFIVALFILPVEIAGEDAGMALSGYEGISGPDYLLTEFRVMVTYIRLLLLPYGQNLDYDYPIYHSLFNPEVYLSLLFVLTAIASGLYLIGRSKGSKSLRPIAFGLLWFFVALSVESSVVPLPMLIDEYRLYLPSAGVFMAAAAAAIYFFEKLKFYNMAVAASLLVPLLLASATYARNRVWFTEVSLWQDVVSKSPNKARGHYNLGMAYSREGEADKAIIEFAEAVRLKPGDATLHTNLGIALKNAGRTDEAFYHFTTAVAVAPEDSDSRFNLGLFYMEKGLNSKAAQEFKAALRIDPRNTQARKFLEAVGYPAE